MSWGRNCISSPSTPQLCPQAQVCGGSIQQHRKDLFWEVGKRLTHSLRCPCLRPYSYNLKAVYLPSNLRVRKNRGVRWYWGRTQALQPFLQLNSSLLAAPGAHLHPLP